MRTLAFLALSVVIAMTWSLLPATASAQEPHAFVEGIQVDWGSFPMYFDVLSPPRLQALTEAGGEYREVAFVVREKVSLPPGKHFTARFYDMEGLEVKWSIVNLTPGPETDALGTWNASIWWVPDMASVAKVKILLE